MRAAAVVAAACALILLGPVGGALAQGPATVNVAPAGSTLHVSWTPVADSDLEGYTVEYRLPGALTPTSVPVGNVTRHALTDLQNDQPYEVQVRALYAGSEPDTLSPVATERPRAFWVATADNIGRLRFRNQDSTRFAFGRDDSYTLTRAPGVNPSLSHPDYSARPTRTYSSFFTFKQDADAGQVGPVNTVMYDLEPNNVDVTQEELNEPGLHMRQFCDLAHAKGFRCITIPSPDLGLRFRQGNETKVQAYLRKGFARDAAATADVTGIQSQLFAFDLEAYYGLVSAVADQARQQNPEVEVIAEVTPVNERKLLDPNQLFSAYVSIRTLVAGMYVAVPLAPATAVSPDSNASREQLMSGFLTRVMSDPIHAPPDTSIVVGPEGTIGQSSAGFAFAATNDSTPAFQCRLDRGSWTACGSPYATQPLPDGAHTLAVRAVDDAGVIDATPASRSFVVEAAAPETAIESAPGAATNDTTPTFAFSANESATFACRLDAAEFTSCTSPTTLEPLADGPHSFEVRATDLAGRVDATPSRVEFAVDTVVPDTAVASGPPPAGRNAKPAFTFTATEPGAGFECRIDGGNFFPCSASTTLGALADGSHALEVRASDAAGNLDPTPASYTFATDTAAPTTRIRSGPKGLARRSRAVFAFTAEDPAPRGPAVAREQATAPITFRCRLDSRPWAACSATKIYSGLSEGRHSFSVRATDGAGNPERPLVTRSWTVRRSTSVIVPSARPPAVALTRAGRFTVPGAAVDCAQKRGPCFAVMTVKRRGSRGSLGVARVKVNPGRTAAVRVRLTPAGRRTIAVLGRALVSVGISVRERRGRAVSDRVTVVLLRPGN